MPQKKVLKIHVHDHKMKYIVLAWQDKCWFGQVAWNAPTLAPGQQMILTVELCIIKINTVTKIMCSDWATKWQAKEMTALDCTGLSKFKFDSE